MEKEYPLSQLKKGETGVVTQVLVADGIRGRLLDLGLVPGTKVTCRMTSASGKLAAYKVSGTVLALRKEQAQLIMIRAEDSAAPAWVVALAGNPNVGKSTVFNGLTGMHQHTGNWPGKTVSSARGYFSLGAGDCELVDLPGIYSLNAQSPEEQVAREFLCSGKAQAVVVVCDANCLERNLNLVLQIQEVHTRVLVCVNLMDQAQNRGIQVDLEGLAGELNAPVVGITARKKGELQKVVEVLETMLSAEDFQDKLSLPDPAAQNDPIQQPIHSESATLVRIAQAREIADGVVNYTRREPDRRDRQMDSLVVNPWLGYSIMLILLAMILWITIVGANYPSQLLQTGFSWLQHGLSKLLVWLRTPEWFQSLLVYGIFQTLSWVVAVMLPPMAIFFPLFTLLEDAGYLPRIAFRLDGAFQTCHACGKQALTMCMGLGCNAVGVMGCRIIDSPRERLLAILTNSLVPCNGRFPTLLLLMTMFFARGASDTGGGLTGALLLTLVLLLGVAMTFLASWILSHTVLRGMSSGFILELPSYRMPQVGKVLVRSWMDRTLFVLGRAVAVAAPAGLLIWCLANIFLDGQSLLQHGSTLLDPIGNMMGLDGVILLAFCLGLPANEVVLPLIFMIYTAQGSLQELPGMGQLGTIFAAQGWTPVTALCLVVFTLLHWPCSTTLLTIRKETGSVWWMLCGAAVPTILGFLCCVLIRVAAGVLG